MQKKFFEFFLFKTSNGMSKQKIILIILAIAAVGAGLYFYQNQSSENSASAPADDNEFKTKLAELQRLRDLKLDTSIFRDKFFQSLQLPEKPTEEPITPGRSNPFFLP